MSEPKTLKDLIISGDVDPGLPDGLAGSALNGQGTYFVGYVGDRPVHVRRPTYSDLPEHVMGFIHKAFLECPIVPYEEMEALEESEEDKEFD